MKNVLETGTKDPFKTAVEIYIKRCPRCGCLFTYQNEDIEYDMDLGRWVSCPQCEVSSGIFIKRKYHGKKERRTKNTNKNN